ncbi:ABC transporter permease [Glutamicibacter uratoxydans]|uniref:ABC transporter permease n=1 Tax=Glutamicibacter uratoxydans TaxID=43667 RepID=UPI003D6FD36E
MENLVSRLRLAGIRFAHLIAVLFGVSFLVYLLLDLLPGDTAEVIVASSANPTEDAVEEIRKQLGLDQPLLVRFFGWFGNALQGDLGMSFRTGQAVTEAIAERLPVTLQLLLMAEVVSLAIAIPLAIAAAKRRDAMFDKVTAVFAFGLQSIPNFVVALVSIVIFSVMLGWLPAIGFVPMNEGLWENIKSLIIPTLALSAGLIPLYMRVLRNEMIRVLQEDFILVARSQGLKSRTVLFRYALKPSLPTLVTVVGINIGTLIGGTIIIELISGLPGIGTLLYAAINNRDYVLVQGVILFVAAAYVVANFLVDIFYTILDPRVEA